MAMQESIEIRNMDEALGERFKANKSELLCLLEFPLPKEVNFPLFFTSQITVRFMATCPDISLFIVLRVW